MRLCMLIGCHELIKIYSLDLYKWSVCGWMAEDFVGITMSYLCVMSVITTVVIVELNK